MLKEGVGRGEVDEGSVGVIAEDGADQLGVESDLSVTTY